MMEFFLRKELTTKKPLTLSAKNLHHTSLQNTGKQNKPELILPYKCHGYRLKPLFTHTSILYLHNEGAFRLRFFIAFYQCQVMEGIVGKEERKLT